MSDRVMYEYKLVVLSAEPDPVWSQVANKYAQLGWRTVGLQPNAVLLEREKTEKYEYYTLQLDLAQSTEPSLRKIVDEASGYLDMGWTMDTLTLRRSRREPFNG